MHIRPSRLDDALEIEAVFRDGKAALARLGISQWQNTPYPDRVEAERDARDHTGFVAVDERTGRIMGVAALVLTGETTYDTIEGSWLTDSSSNAATYATIHRTCTAHDFARQGVMDALFDYLEHAAAEHGMLSMRVDTHPENVPMRSLLLKRGYSHCGTISLGEIDPDPLRDAFEKLL